MNRAKKIGILTHYYNSQNFGGNLQAYALTDFLRNNGFDAEQICYSMDFSDDNIKSKLKIIIKKMFFLSRYSEYETMKKTRMNKFDNFNKKVIRHSDDVYDDNSISSSNDKYDCFIVGSDQVWNLHSFFPAFFLDFTRDDKKRVSYSASIANYDMPNNMISYVKKSLSRFDYISVREDDAITFIEKITNKKVLKTVDPVLLKSRSEWDNICADKIIDGDYVLFYYLGLNEENRKIARKYADKKKLKLVAISNSSFMFFDEKNSDECVIPTPEEFISLIKHAKYIFTDSFHAVVFSYIYSKQFFVFKRDNNDNTISRINDILSMLNLEKRFCFDDRHYSIEYLNSLANIEYPIDCEIDNMIKISKEFLLDSVNK